MRRKSRANPIENPVCPSFRQVIFLLSLFVLLPAPARADWGMELTPFAGFRAGGSFTDNTTGLDLDVDEGESFGLILGLRATHETDYELFYSLQRTELKGAGVLSGATLFDGGRGRDHDLEEGGTAPRGERIFDDPSR